MRRLWKGSFQIKTNALESIFLWQARTACGFTMKACFFRWKEQDNNKNNREKINEREDHV